MSAVLEAQEPRAGYLAALQPPLVQQFDLLATAPGGVARLRELILTLAVQGKLVPQDPSDEPASVLLQKIRTEKNRLIATGVMKREKPMPAIQADEWAIEVPDGWELTRLGTLIDLISGQHLGPTEYANGLALDIPYLTGPAEFGVNSPEPTRSTIERRAVAIQGDILVTVKGSGVGKLNVVSQPEIAISRQLMAIRPISVNGKYLFIVLETLGVKFQQQSIGIAIPGIGREDVSLSVLGLPPLAEQSRIVTRVKELMRLCDALESQRQLETAQHAQLLGTLLGTLTDSTSPDELAANWQRVSDHFDLLLDRPEAVDALEQTILQLAVRGLLVPQDPNDEPASVLLQKVRAEKDRLIAEEKVRRDKPLPAIAEAEAPFNLQDKWEWARVGDLVDMLNGYAFKSEWFKVTGTRLLRNVNISHGQIEWSQPACIESAAASEFASFDLKAGDIVLSLDRPIISTGLKYAVVKASDLPCLLLQRVARLSPHVNAMSDSYFLIWLQSDLFVGTIDPGRSNGVPHISTKQVANLVIGLPPLAEQTRIVARVNQLRGLCADLRQRLSARQTTHSHLAEALVEV